MNNIKKLIKDNVTFAVILLVCLTFFVIALTGDYQTTTHVFKVDHFTFLNGGAKMAIVFFIVPIVLAIAALVLRFFVPKDKMKKTATVVAGGFIALAIAACVFLLLLVIIIPDQYSPSFTQLGDDYDNMADPYYSKVFNFQYLSMLLSLAGFIVLGCYGAATCSE